MKLDKFEEQIFFSTVRITIENSQGVGSSIGTGFILRASLNDPQNRSVILLISNKHVFKDPSQKMVLNFHKKKPDGTGPELGQIVTLQENAFNSIYKEHPNQLVDLACINISRITFPGMNVFYKNLGTEMLCDFSEEDILPGKDVLFIGYPENRFDVFNNLPILRRGYIASIPTVNFNNQHQLIIDAQVFPGSSGSPVFTISNGYYKLLGVVAQTMVRNQQLQAIPANKGYGVEQIIGLGIVIKATLLSELVNITVDDIKSKLNISQESEPTSEEEKGGKDNCA